MKLSEIFSKTAIIWISATVVVVGGSYLFYDLTKSGTIPNYTQLEFLEPAGPNQSLMGDGHQEDGVLHNGILKPVIYLYPKQTQDVSVKLHYQGELAITYPSYDNGWDVTASPNGTLINKDDGREYSYLFWEANYAGQKYDMGNAFLIKGSDTEKFLQDKLELLGLTPKEYNEFIVFWLPKMKNNRYNLIHFATKEEYDDKATLDIRPKPDSIRRVFMVYKKLDRPVKATPQVLKPFVREGFSVIEWGGTEVR